MADEESQSGHKEEPIIIKKKKGHGEHGAHGGSWKVAYADFVTAMMAFFIVMWIINSNDKVKVSVSAYFKDPGIMKFTSGKIAVPVDLHLKPTGTGKGEGKKEGESKENFQIKSKASIMLEMAYGGDSTKITAALHSAAADSALAASRVKEAGKKIQEMFNDLLAQRPDLAELLKSIKIEITDEGLVIELFETKESLFFEIGSAKLKPKAVEIIADIAKILYKLPNRIDVEGHTDMRGYGKNAQYTNWELSADRANSARRVLEHNGLGEGGQINKVTGFADQKLRNPMNPYDAMNRRVAIVIRQMSMEQFLQLSGAPKNEE